MDPESGSYSSFKKAPYRAVKHENYFAIYDELLESFRGREFTFVEIGVLHGGSLFMWRDYFGGSVRIIGVDLSSEALKFEEFGFEIFVGDQADPSFWADFFSQVGPVDVVLDDGGHTNRQQIVTLQSTIPNIRDGGLLIVEDTVCSYSSDFGNPSSKSFTNQSKLLIDDLHSDSLPSPMKTSGFEKYIFSIAYFKSVVAFRVDRIKAAVPATPVLNSGAYDEVVDMRFSQISPVTKLILLFLSRLNRLQNKLEKHSPLVGHLFMLLARFPRLVLNALYKLQIRDH